MFWPATLSSGTTSILKNGSTLYLECSCTMVWVRSHAWTLKSFNTCQPPAVGDAPFVVHDKEQSNLLVPLTQTRADDLLQGLPLVRLDVVQVHARLVEMLHLPVQRRGTGDVPERHHHVSDLDFLWRKNRPVPQNNQYLTSHVVLSVRRVDWMWVNSTRETCSKYPQSKHAVVGHVTHCYCTSIAFVLTQHGIIYKPMTESTAVCMRFETRLVRVTARQKSVTRTSTYGLVECVSSGSRCSCTPAGCWSAAIRRKRIPWNRRTATAWNWFSAKPTNRNVHRPVKRVYTWCYVS